ncbi:valine--tRNA ligase [Candidatus Curtissbacteria bacterium]|nr:valine--tRNA ligase [Candidatus Curtissbacteria bacterium]
MTKDFLSEAKIYSFWEKENFFSASPHSGKKSFSLLIPPPNLTGELHLGHAMQHSILDAIARFKRLQGFDVLLLPGVDHAGIQFEATLEKKLQKENLSKEKLGREKWLAKAWEFKEEIYKSVSSTWRFMGLSADWSREVFTLDPGGQKAVYQQFKTYYDAGLIYKGPYIVQWCPKDQTAIEDVEVEYEERIDKLYFIKYSVGQHPASGKSGKEFIKVATTRPETIFADVAVAVHPDDDRYKNLWGLHATLDRPGFLEPSRSPVSSGLPLIRDERVDPKFGSGALKITPGHDFLDYEVGRDHKLPIINVVNKQGRLTEVAGKYAGMKVSEARTAIVKELKEKGYLLDEVEYIHNVAVCERCKSVVEPIISEEWFVKVGSMAKDAIKVIKAGKIKFLPSNYSRILVDWLSNIHDWCISRSLWWGHRIPVWYPSTSLRTSGPSTSSGSNDRVVSLESPGKGWIQDEQVLDTWFSSGLWPLSTLGWPEEWRMENGHRPGASGPQGKWKIDENTFSKYFPWDFEISAPEIKYLWIARMIMISQFLVRQIPFKTMFFHGMLRDLQGRKFSKSLGNGIEPTYLIEKWGVDATRMTLYTYSIPGRDGRVSREILDERGKNFRNFATKIRNIARYVIELKVENGKLKVNRNEHKDDKWIKDELQITIERVTTHLNDIELHLAVDEIYDFIWHKFADVYVERSKERRSDAQPVLEYVLRKSLILLHPFMPFVTEEIYQKFEERERSIMVEKWPSFGKVKVKKPV